MLLLQHGAKVDNTTKDMYTALHIAAKEGQDEVKCLLIKRIVDYVECITLLENYWEKHREIYI